MQVLEKAYGQPMEVIVITLWEKYRSWTRIWEVTSLDRATFRRWTTMLGILWCKACSKSTGKLFDLESVIKCKYCLRYYCKNCGNSEYCNKCWSWMIHKDEIILPQFNNLA